MGTAAFFFSRPQVGWRWDVGFVALLVGTGVLDGPETNGYLKPHGVCGMNGNKIVGTGVPDGPSKRSPQTAFGAENGRYAGNQAFPSGGRWQPQG